MGGTIAVSIRRADGREHRMARWTNPLGRLFLDLKFIEGDDSFLDEYIARWDDMRADWIDNNITGNYRYNMTPCYGDWPHLAPNGYGLVVIDYKTKTILHSQGYSAMNQFHSSEFSRNCIYAGVEEWPEPSTVEVCKSGRVMRSEWCDKTEGFVEREALTGWEEETNRLEKLVEGLDPMNGTTRRWYNRYIVDLKPWTMERFGEDGNSLTEMWNRLVDLGFEFSDEEEAEWDAFIKEHTYDEGEE